MREKEMLEKIATMLREAYPDAVSAKVFVNEQEVSVETEYRTKLNGISMKNLKGEWIRC